MTDRQAKQLTLRKRLFFEERHYARWADRAKVCDKVARGAMFVAMSQIFFAGKLPDWVWLVAPLVAGIGWTFAVFLVLKAEDPN